MNTHPKGRVLRQRSQIGNTQRVVDLMKTIQSRIRVSDPNTTKFWILGVR